MPPSRFISLSGLTFVLVASSPLLPVLARSGQAPDTLPEASGKAVLIRVCTTCHDTDLITEAPRTVPGWIDTVYSMRDFGAEMSEDEFKTVTDYLLVNLAHLRVNTATAEEMAPVLGVTMGVAEGVVAYRDARGGFKTIDDLKGAPELDAATIDALAPRLLFGN
jgi:competence ComEA-like helix-hairpin-helix protein